MTKSHSVLIILADVVRLAIEIIVYSVSLLFSVAAFLTFWRSSEAWLSILAFPAAVAAFIVGFCIMVLVLRLVFVRRVLPGNYNLRERYALRWIMGQSLLMLVHRSFPRGWIQDFAIQRYLFYRLMGAQIDVSFFIGEGARILDPWTLEVGRNVTIGAFSLICGHTIVGDSLTVKRIRIRDSATIGMRSVILAGVEIGENAIVGAGAVVTKGTMIPDGEIWAGVPARKIGEIHQPANEAT